MKPPHIQGRQSYRSRGVVDFSRAVVALPLALAACLMLAVLMYGVFRLGWYLVVLMPLLFGFGAGGVALAAVAWSHCRNRFVGAFCGVLCGSTLFLGYYYVGMVVEVGSEGLSHPEWLPRYISLRMQTDVIQDTPGGGEKERKREKPAPERNLVNWLVFSMEFLLILALTLSAALGRASRPYCEGCRLWMKRTQTQFPSDAVERLVAALRDGTTGDLARLFSAPTYPSVPNVTVALDHCVDPEDRAARKCPVYLSVKTIQQNPQGVALDTFDSSKGVLYAHVLQVRPEEMTAIAPRFPVLQPPSGTRREPSPPPALQQFKATLAPGVPTESSVELVDVEPEYARRAFNRKTTLICNAMVLSTVVCLFAGLGLMAWGGSIASPSKEKQEEVNPDTKALGIALLSTGGVLLLFALTLGLVDPSYFGNRYLRNLVVKELRRRPDRWVNPDDSLAIFVEIVPKPNWGAFMLDNASDVGFLRLDLQRREVLFEGDRQRFRLPAAAITGCAVEYFVQGQGTAGATKLYYVVLRADLPTGFWEAPIRERGGLGILSSRKRLRRMTALAEALNRIRALGGQTEATTS